MNSLFPEKPPGGPSEHPQPPSYSSGPSYPVPTYAPFSTAFASLSLHRSDRIRCLQFPTSDIDGIRAAIKGSYPFGIQREQPYGPSHEFKLNSYP